MERDALLSHGVAFCLHDRLMNCSDSHLAYLCNQCGELLSVYAQPLHKIISSSSNPAGAGGTNSRLYRSVQYCSICKSSAHIRPVNLPYVYRYLANELAAMGIRITTKLSE
jgi:DNA-directed RNA polymerase I subunit RPA2